MKDSRHITVIQAATILASTIIGVGILTLPLSAVQAADSGAPLVTFAGMLLALIGLIWITLLGMRFPKQSFVEYSEAILGKWFAWGGSALLIVFIGILTSLVAREFGEVVVTAILKQTPLEAIVLAMLLLVTFPSRKGIEIFSYIHYFYFPLLLVPGLLIIVLSFRNAEFINLEPIWGNNPSGFLLGILTLGTSFQGSFIMMMVIPAMRHPRKSLPAGVWGMLIAGVLYVMVVIASVSVFGADEIKLTLWPTLELAKMTSLPANILERLDALFLIAWVITVFTSLFSCYYFTVYAISKLFRLADQRMLSFFMLPIIFTLAVLPGNVVQLYQIIQIAGQAGLLFTIAYPGLLLFVAIVRKKKGIKE